MRITVKTAGLLGKHLPAGSIGNRAEIEIADGATPATVIASLGMPSEASYLVTLNGASIPVAERATRKLKSGDTLAIMPPLRGG